MASIKIPTPLRVYTDNQAELSVSGATVGQALQQLIAQYADLETHLFQDGKLRSFVNIYLDDEDIRFLNGLDTAITEDAKLRIIPTIAGGNDAPRVDAHALKFGNGATIALLVLAFVLDVPLLVAFVALAQLLGGLNVSFAPYRLAYQAVVKAGVLRPHVVVDNAAPHRFAMLVGAAFNGVGAGLLLVGVGAGWLPVAIVVVLANLNFWLNFCLGCWMYYQFNRLGVPLFSVSPVQDQS